MKIVTKEMRRKAMEFGNRFCRTSQGIWERTGTGGECDIEIREVLSRTESVKAGYLGEAICELMDKYRKGEIVLDADDFKGVDYIPVEKR